MAQNWSCSNGNKYDLKQLSENRFVNDYKYVKTHVTYNQFSNPPSLGIQYCTHFRPSH